MAYQFNEAQEAWLKALESGEYEQSKNCLFNGNGYCCLGVACVVAGLQFEKVGSAYIADGAEAELPESLLETFKLFNSYGDFRDDSVQDVATFRTSGLASANDRGATFSEIATFIRSNPTAVFKE